MDFFFLLSWLKKRLKIIKHAQQEIRKLLRIRSKPESIIAKYRKKISRELEDEL